MDLNQQVHLFLDPLEHHIHNCMLFDPMLDLWLSLQHQRHHLLMVTLLLQVNYLEPELLPLVDLLSSLPQADLPFSPQQEDQQVALN